MQRKAARRAPKTAHKPVPKRKVAPSVPTRAIVVRKSPDQPWLLQPEEVTLVKNVICKGASDVELQYCLTVARRYKLDPFQGQIWFVKRWDSEALRTDGKKGSNVFVPVVGINGLLHIAARDHRDFGSYSQTEYGPMIEVQYQKLGQGPFIKLKVPEWAMVATLKKGCTSPTYGQVWWEEIYKNIDFSPTVRQMPRLMLAKCAKAQATRTAYPSTGGLLITEETQGPEFQNITPGGRLIYTPEPESVPYTQEIPPEAEDPKVKAYEERAAKEREVAAQQPGLTYRLVGETYRIEGSNTVLTDNKPILREVLGESCGWSPLAKAVVCTPSQLGTLISRFEAAKVSFKNLDAQREPGE